ncbi:MULTISPECIES: YezD family protein [Paenibacillus]|uniref:YezD family protein n=1 Tax=Paenibacillus brevis TaxID=2841508 RepID=A0ABS6FJE7_9BACL|nr:YezD family protein [Paenibacillus antibioticophila]MBU5670300.1 YezD family protein [Paenibacillus brevis]
MAKPLKVDGVWLDRIAELLDELEFGSLNIVVHEGQIVQVERTERKRYELNGTASGRKGGPSRQDPKPRRKAEI